MTQITMGHGVSGCFGTRLAPRHHQSSAARRGNRRQRDCESYAKDYQSDMQPSWYVSQPLLPLDTEISVGVCILLTRENRLLYLDNFSSLVPMLSFPMV